MEKDTHTLNAYLEINTLNQGDLLKLMVQSKYQTFQLEISNYDTPNLLLYQNTLDGVIQSWDDTTFLTGCKWKPCFEYIIPTEWGPGLYLIHLSANNDEYWVPFVIKGESTNLAPIVVLMNTYTWQAYNPWGGGSFYRYLSSKDTPWGNQRACKSGSRRITFERPNDVISKGISHKLKNSTAQHKDHLIHGELYLYDWLKKNNYQFNLITDDDLNLGYQLEKHQVLILNCHPEYWTTQMMLTVRKRANHIISLAGNVGYRKVEVQPNRTMTKRGLWSPEHLKDITGSYYSNPGFNTYAPYKIIKPSHWVFSGISDLETFGAQCLNNPDKTLNLGQGASGHETDKHVVGPALILAKGINPRKGGGDIVFSKCTIMERKFRRKIFSVGSVVFTGCLPVDQAASKILQNVLQEFLK